MTTIYRVRVTRRSDQVDGDVYNLGTVDYEKCRRTVKSIEFWGGEAVIDAYELDDTRWTPASASALFDVEGM